MFGSKKSNSAETISEGWLRGLFRSRRGKEDAATVSVEEVRNRMFLHLRPDGWLWILRNAEGQTLRSERDRVPQEIINLGPEAVFRAVAAAIGQEPELLRGLQDAVILLEDPGILYSDGKGDLVRYQGAPALRDVGAQLLSVKRATFGQQILEGDGDGLPILAFADAAALSRYLGCLEGLAPLVTSIVPLGALLLQKAAAIATGEGTGCAVHLSHLHTYVALANTALGIAVVRILPVGVATLVAALAEANGITQTEARDMLAERDLLSALPVEQVASIHDGLSFGVAERALVPPVARLLADLRDTFTYFDEQRMGGKTRRINVLHPAGDLRGFPELVRRILGSEVQFAEEGPLEAMTVMPLDGLANLFTGAEGSLVTVGKVAYSYGKDRLVPVHAPMQDTARQKSRFGSSSGGRSQTSAERRLAAQKRLGGRGRTQDSTGKPAGLFAIFHRKLSLNPKLAAITSEQRQEWAGQALFAMMMGAVIYYGWTLYEDLDIGHSIAVNQAGTFSTKNVELRKDVGFGGGDMDRAVADKVLWTEKFLTLGRHTSETIWLTDVFLADQERQIGNLKISDKKMVMEGAVLPASDGHVLEIAKFIRNLLEDKEGFMSDFREITFDGAHVDTSESEQIVKFRVEAIYDANKRISRVVNTNATNEDLNPMQKLQNNVNTHNRAAERAITGKVTD
ncbi:MAG: hypothetical protein ABT940_02945 [Alphaproteobacteria bacterium]